MSSDELFLERLLDQLGYRADVAELLANLAETRRYGAPVPDAAPR